MKNPYRRWGEGASKGYSKENRQLCQRKIYTFLTQKIKKN